MKLAGLLGAVAGPARRRRGVAALIVAVGSLVCAAAPAHANLEAVYTINGSPCETNFEGQTFCVSTTHVAVVLPPDYANCAVMEAPIVEGGTYDCQATAEGGVLEASLSWVPGSCATQGVGGVSWFEGDYAAPGWSMGAGGDTYGPATCATIDYSYTQTFYVTGCPGTSFVVTADIKGHANGTSTNSYAVNGTGPCAGLWDVAVVEGP